MSYFCCVVVVGALFCLRMRALSRRSSFPRAMKQKKRHRSGIARAAQKAMGDTHCFFSERGEKCKDCARQQSTQRGKKEKQREVDGRAGWTPFLQKSGTIGERQRTMSSPAPVDRAAALLCPRTNKPRTGEKKRKKKKRRTPCFLFFFRACPSPFLLLFCDGKCLHFWAVAPRPKRPPGRQMASRGTTQPEKNGRPPRMKRNRRRDRDVSSFSLLRKRGRGEKGLAHDGFGTTSGPWPWADQRQRGTLDVRLFFVPTSLSLSAGPSP